jgi:hypothetical protein
MRKAAETPCKQRAFPDPPRIPAGPVPDPFPSNTPATPAAPATTNPPERPEHSSRKRLGPFPECTVGPGLPSPPVNAVGACAGERAGAPALAEALPSRLGGRPSFPPLIGCWTLDVGCWMFSSPASISAFCFLLSIFPFSPAPLALRSPFPLDCVRSPAYPAFRYEKKKLGINSRFVHL